jgi:predicted adenine nucleotide alpha hydrolase (AANH) superfamily ATPase
VATQKKIRVVWDIPHENEDYGITAWLLHMGKKRDTGERCPECYRMRLEMTAKMALSLGFSAFSTTLLYSRYQMHNLIKLMGFSIGNKYGLDFIYRDFRKGWQPGIDMSIEMGIYRQPYCGCIYSEQERYARRAEKLHRKLANENMSSGR